MKKIVFLFLISLFSFSLNAQYFFPKVPVDKKIEMHAVYANYGMNRTYEEALKTIKEILDKTIKKYGYENIINIQFVDGGTRLHDDGGGTITAFYFTIEDKK